MNPTASDEDGLSREQYGALAAFRYRLRRFLTFSEAEAAKHGLPTQQHQALLTLAGHEGGPATVGLLAEQLLIAPHSAAELVARMVEAGLLIKGRDSRDRRRSELSLTPYAMALLHDLTAAHLRELRDLGPALVAALAGGAEKATQSPPTSPV